MTAADTIDLPELLLGYAREDLAAAQLRRLRERCRVHLTEARLRLCGVSALRRGQLEPDTESLELRERLAAARMCLRFAEEDLRAAEQLVEIREYACRGRRRAGRAARGA
jgi:hypothetical protein